MFSRGRGPHIAPYTRRNDAHDHSGNRRALLTDKMSLRYLWYSLGWADPRIDRREMHRLYKPKSLRKITLAIAAIGLSLGLQLAGVLPASATPFFQAFAPGLPTESTPCSAGNYATGPVLEGPALGANVKNGCSVRVWLAQNRNGTGYLLCISPGGASNINKSYLDIGVSTNKAHC